MASPIRFDGDPKNERKVGQKSCPASLSFLVIFSEKKTNLFFFPSSLMTIIKLQPQ